MKKFFTLFALAAVVAAPASLAAELAGLPVPSSLAAGNVFSGFIFAVVLLTIFSDYTRRQPRVATLKAQAAGSAAAAKAAHPLAA